MVAPAIPNLSSWCKAEPRLAFTSDEPGRFSIPLPNGERAVVDVVSDPPFVTLACHMPFTHEVTAHLSAADAHAAVVEFIQLLPRARSSLADASLAADKSGVELQVRVHEEGLNGHTFLVAATELIKLTELLEAGVDGAARAAVELQEARRAFDDAIKQAEKEAERVAEDAHQRSIAREAEEAARLQAVETAVQGLTATATCSNCGTALAPGAQFCVSCGTPVGNGATAAPPQPAASSTCANCGAALAPGARFCVSCGTPVG